MKWVYPRRCGGTALVVATVANGQGLSPQVRGNPGRGGGRPGRRGSIPAGAGEPHPGVHMTTSQRVYPRRCGGTTARRAGRSGVSGLSPQVRGNLLQSPRHGAAGGSIPAGAGEPGELRDGRIVSQVYPRRCGGTSRHGRGRDLNQGLSPQVRGNRRRRRPTDRPTRSIPAGAGEPRDCGPGRREVRVYPRRCGGTLREVFRLTPAEGLSPQVRGNRVTPSEWVRTVRSIPAGAGEP